MMKYCLRPAALFLLCCTLLCTVAFGQKTAFPARVVKVTDGDTVQIAVHGTSKLEKVRLYGIDAPESKQAFGTEARHALAKLVNGRMVRIEQQNRDRYNRIVGKIIFDGNDICLEMLELGMAWHYRQYCKDPAYQQAERKAKEARIGLWHEKDPIPPWKFRSRKRSKNNK